ncbi:Helicase conserved C-terminal domain-containing protein [Actinomadura meyerae]|uniref:Helicase conserved C-terminal domain-containing protein n=1 Tax=Actinomadura meyerae TaxID=240840 RepID=A0A239C5V5_9ACTN|nr:SNF2-related protein [Actinomadura meyerae]SNS15627.1 Helicase conserved C-terminal domain-containing protein [Actinomadura meyerae]
MSGEARDVLRDGWSLLAAARDLIADHRRAVADVHAALAPLRAEAAKEQLREIPPARLKDVTDGRLRLGPLEEAGFGSVADVLEATPYRLQLLPGIGPQTARQLHAAAGSLAEAAERSVSVRIDVDRRDEAMAPVVVALHRLVNAGPDLPKARAAAEQVDERFAPLVRDARPAASWWRRLIAGPARRERARQAVGELAEALRSEAPRETRLLISQASVDLLRPAASPDEAWIDFELRASDYQTLLAEMAALDPEHGAAEGFLPRDLAARVKAQPLDDAYRRVSLRGYQAFGARFALVQRRVILGDEMGLGKTIQAIAAIAHLRARGATHFLVACPASVLINWVREIETRSSLAAHPLHGPGRAAALKKWAGDGGIAVTTLSTLHSLDVPADLPIGMFVVDEAHYAKNHETRRAKAVARWCLRTEHVLFLTGTPMENRVEEFRSLVAHLRPEVAERVRPSDAALGPRAFRSAVAPVYLRRNQRDVLVELPEVVHVDELEEFSRADAAAYRRAVADGNFMAMRRAAYAVPKKSAKLGRLTELVAEAAENDLKVVVFSYFRDVLATVGEALGPEARGPIAGDTPVARRQEIVDAFTAEPGHAVLLAQIQAGGVGLNLQAASVVILCEPQVKPTMETQAVARAHRMGQVRTVQVHRLLTPGSVDERMLEILRAKSLLFDEYARRSDLAEQTPDAVDVSEQALARQIVAEEQERLGTG